MYAQWKSQRKKSRSKYSCQLFLLGRNDQLEPVAGHIGDIDGHFSADWRPAGALPGLQNLSECPWSDTVCWGGYWVPCRILHIPAGRSRAGSVGGEDRESGMEQAAIP